MIPIQKASCDRYFRLLGRRLYSMFVLDHRFRRIFSEKGMPGILFYMLRIIKRRIPP